MKLKNKKVITIDIILLILANKMPLDLAAEELGYSSVEELIYSFRIVMQDFNPRLPFIRNEKIKKEMNERLELSKGLYYLLYVDSKSYNEINKEQMRINFLNKLNRLALIQEEKFEIRSYDTNLLRNELKMDINSWMKNISINKEEALLKLSSICYEYKEKREMEEGVYVKK